MQRKDAVSRQRDIENRGKFFRKSQAKNYGWVYDSAQSFLHVGDALARLVFLERERFRKGRVAVGALKKL
jgi:hypothetical protein